MLFIQLPPLFFSLLCTHPLSAVPACAAWRLCKCIGADKEIASAEGFEWHECYQSLFLLKCVREFIQLKRKKNKKKTSCT